MATSSYHSLLTCQPSTSSNSLEIHMKLQDETFIYDISMELEVNIPSIGYDAVDVMTTVSAIMTAEIFVRNPSWNFLATPILRIIDSALLTRDEDWETRGDRLVVQMIIHMMGHFVNIENKPQTSVTTLDKFNFNNNIDHSKIILSYAVKVLFTPGILSAMRIYDSHGWTRDDTPQDDDQRSIKLRKILEIHRGMKTLMHEATWRDMFPITEDIKKEKNRDANADTMIFRREFIVNCLR